MVYKAQDTKLDRFVALKFLPSYLSNSEEQKARLCQEAKAASVLSHPNILTIHDINDYKGQLYIIMEYIEGETLKSKIQNQKLKDDEIVNFGLQIGQGLKAAHEKGVIHRDLKSENLMVTNDQRVKIMDFGLAKLKGRKDLTKTKATVGTLSYMSPEQIQGAELDQRTDLWSLGVVLYEMLCGQLPFKGDYEASIMYSILNEEPDYPEIPACKLSRPLQEIIKKALQKDLIQRYQKVEEVITDLHIAGQGRQQPQLFSSAHLKSIAVLPFDNISPDKENEYFSDGLTEEIIANLSKIRNLKVISRTSIMRYKDVKKPLKQIANELAVQYILEGSVRKHSNDLRITAQLIDAKQDTHLWAEKYKGTMEDVFQIQEKVAEEITKALKIQLTPSEQKGLEKRYTENTIAYQLYLKGRFYWNKRTEEVMLKGIEYFKLAIEQDPSYALAHVGLADSYNVLGFYNMLSPKEAFPKAKAAAMKALELDTGLAEAYPSLAYAKHYYDWEWSEAEREFKKAIEIIPGYPIAYLFYGNYLTARERFKGALEAFKKARELDPLSLIINCATGWCYYYARRYDESILQLRKALELDENFFLAHLWLGRAYQEKGMMEEAIAEYQKSKPLSGHSPMTIAALGHVYAVSEEKEKAFNVLEELNKLAKRRYVSAYHIAVIYTGLDEKDLAFEWLEKAYDERSQSLVFLKVDPALDTLRSDARFIDLLKKVGLEK